MDKSHINTPCPDYFWKLRCGKSAHRCGAKHFLKWISTKHLSSGPLLEVEMWKKCTPLWREALFEVNMYKTPQLRAPFGSCEVEKVHAVVARSAFRSQNVQITTRSDHFWKLRDRISVLARTTFESRESKCTKKHLAFLAIWRRKSARRCGAKHIVVARSTLGSQIRQKLMVFILFRCVTCRCIDRYMDIEKLVKSVCELVSFSVSQLVG